MMTRTVTISPRDGTGYDLVSGRKRNGETYISMLDIVTEKVIQCLAKA
jgi:hypothetical protein